MGKSRKVKSKQRRKERHHAERAEELAEAHDATQAEEAVHHFFWKAGSPFSQWHISRYTLDGVTYCCAEQGMMHGKALLFGDSEAAEAIMETNCPRKMKAYGQMVRGFKQSVWNQHREDIVYRNNVAKFTQNDHLRGALLATRGGLVEASPSDKIWGIGLHERDARFVPAHRWPGLNLLGNILTRVRDEVLGGVHDGLIEAEGARESDDLSREE
eukprot:CAMPEP_0183292256 /NCGR_PEP_ID=MMETSP0160_2-20130417/1376_1 /TAXON_ID=2839 ORGANISM="Odontella Sinensis, Strain Grunow 1884" /NCGR_SAMPLE_ID=MMETSP0160_2 /ASSEMBLY_ACC=CAM_ASM_000250 /LENGTH=213 /DNA_ID=CAMNT_0025453179 /DNA_START=82 /DNA_END=720 /DNA_ORIENTATION=+